MSTDEYVPDEDWVPTEEEVRHFSRAWLTEGDFDRFLARVRRDAARGAIDGLIADKAHMTVLLHAENGGNVEDVLTHYRDTLHPEETP